MNEILGSANNDTFYDTAIAERFTGGEGRDTVSYVNAQYGIAANLASGSAYKLLRVLPFGDSITFGVVESATRIESGGYRTPLVGNLEAAGIRIDLVGTMQDGPALLSDRDHEGHPGWTLNQLNAIDSEVVARERPDAVLLISGTNDSGADTVNQMLNDLRNLLVSLSDSKSDMTVFVASVPPIRVGEQSQARADRVDSYNDAMPSVVAELAAAGRKVVFVDMRDLAVVDISSPPSDNGLHPNLAGYELIAAHFEEALREQFRLNSTGYGSDRDTFQSIENLTGSVQADHLTGDGGGNVFSGLDGNDMLRG
ncbi:SGNH/GDSL hydrolase family protein, partial [Methylobacterium iners]